MRKCVIKVRHYPEAGWSSSAQMTGLSSLSLWALWPPDPCGASLSLWNNKVQLICRNVTLVE